MKGDEILLSAAKTFAERAKVYGENYKKVGGALAAMFPEPPKLETAEDHNRYYIFTLIVMKLSRYANNFSTGGHQDSIHDAAVYAAILESIDSERAPPTGDVLKKHDYKPSSHGTCAVCCFPEKSEHHFWRDAPEPPPTRTVKDSFWPR